MNAHPEAALQTMIVKFVREAVAQPHFFFSADSAKKATAMTRIREKARGVVSGTPDTHLIVPGFSLIAVELKAPGNKPTEQQVAVGQAIVRAGGIWHWCDTVAGYCAILRREGVPLAAHAELYAAGHDATLASAAIRREEARTGVPSKKRYRPQAAKPSAAQIARSVARQRRVAH